MNLGCILPTPNAPGQRVDVGIDLYESHKVGNFPNFIQRARTARLVNCFVRCGNPILRSPEGRSDYGRHNENTHNGTTRLFARKRYFRVLRLFFAYFFLARQKKVCPRSDSCGVTAKTEPPVNPEKRRHPSGVTITPLARRAWL